MTTPQQQLEQIDRVAHDLAQELQVLKLVAGGLVTYSVAPFDAYVLSASRAPCGRCCASPGT